MNTITQNSKNLVWAAVAAVCLASVTVGAHADEIGVPARTVRYSDLNLNTQVGAATLYNRIRNAAEQVCGDVDSRRLDLAVPAKACVDQAIAKSVRMVNEPKLTREFDAHMGVAPKTINVATLR